MWRDTGRFLCVWSDVHSEFMIDREVCAVGFPAELIPFTGKYASAANVLKRSSQAAYACEEVDEPESGRLVGGLVSLLAHAVKQPEYRRLRLRTPILIPIGGLGGDGDRAGRLLEAQPRSFAKPRKITTLGRWHR